MVPSQKNFEEIVLGISPLDCDTNISLFRGETLLFAAGEERFTRIKQQNGFPHHALRRALQETSIRLEEIDSVAYPFLTANQESLCLIKNFSRLARRMPWEPIPKRDRLLNIAGASCKLLRGIRLQQKYFSEMMKNLKRLGLAEKVHCYHHHLSHAHTAYYFSGFKECLALIVDGYGTGFATSVWKCDPHGITLLGHVRATDSLGDFFASLTHALGFRANRHEGKVLGLAAYGNPEILKSIFEARINVADGPSYKIFGGSEIRFWIEKLLKKHPREVIAAAAQNTLEKILTHYVSHFVAKTGITHIGLAGGVAANVKLNQKIAECRGVTQVFVFPGMSDVGAGIGAVLAHLAKRDSLTPKIIQNVYWGPDYSEGEMEKAIQKQGLPYGKIPNLEEKVADLIAAGKIVGWFDGRMEFGPRALGHRSILAPATRKEMHNLLNEKLSRSEFMPFAPATLFELREECYLETGTALKSAEFMTITFQCTEKMKKLCPAVVHVDGTARPQLIKKEINPRYYTILQAYYQKTGVPSIINTSFNIHEEPIVCSPEDALRAFQTARLDYLVLGPFLIPLAENFL